LQNSVSFAEARAVFRSTGCKTAFFRGCSFKTEVLKEPLHKDLELAKHPAFKYVVPKTELLEPALMTVYFYKKQS
jgi:hypothetical protein